ncbi:cytochrome P450 [Paraliomyxa miuraensis]|uniref:cytochrome P450 n=1 Tax=Paraliomyxa miuraensis TaxID=376150 RepID=UPI00225B1EB7|nr:cytochrome P450 [Paraliomyxa miuraensis]MCX4243381.1 cytochrome P450 [Paraliomyxa miuraensis]
MIASPRELLGRPRENRRGRRRPPGPPALPWLGAMPSFAPDLLGAMVRFRDRYGDVVHMPLPGAHHTYLLNHPDDVQAVLVGEHAHVMKDEVTRDLSRMLGQGLLTSEGETWKRHRKLAAPSFQPRTIARFGDTMVERTRRLLDQLPARSVRDVHRDMMRITLEIVLDTMFGADTVRDIDTVGDLVSTLLEGYAEVALTWRALLPRFMRARTEDRIDRAIERIDAILYELIAARRQAPVPGDALLDRLLAAQDDEGQGMTDRQLRDEVATVFLAGHETTALALSYALHLLAAHPEVAGRLRTEIDQVLGERAATVDDVPRLRLCDAVLRESMRLHPPAYLVGRELLEEREIAGYPMPAGSQVLMAQWVVHRDPRWYEAPEVFWPDRWLHGQAQRLHRFAYFPFGGGPRICVGNHFAMLEGLLVLATLVQAIEVRPRVPPHPLRPSTAVTLRPVGGVWLDVRRR